MHFTQKITGSQKSDTVMVVSVPKVECKPNVKDKDVPILNQLSVTSWRGSGDIPPLFLTLALDGSKLLASYPFCFTPRERTSGTYCTGGWVGPRAGLDAVEKRNIPTKNWTLIPWLAYRMVVKDALYSIRNISWDQIHISEITIP
jgi:hypothetical protein